MWVTPHFIISTCQDIDENLICQIISNNLAKEEANVLNLELEQLIDDMKCQVLEVFQPLISFLHAFHMKNKHNMF